jgi:hypothetical protein
MESFMKDNRRTGFHPLNLTARSEPVLGNPITARPESGADNSHPGLEFDTRMLNRIFFPGLVFDFQYGQGARLVEVHPERSKDSLGGFRPEHVADPKTMVFLWYIVVKSASGGPNQVYEVYNLDGYGVLRIVSSLGKGPLLVVVGRSPETVPPDVLEKVTAMVAEQVLGKKEWPGESLVAQDKKGLQIAVLCGERAEYLDENGVIDADAIAPGQLTESLCSPWQWDFAECACYYWAAARPDIVVGEEKGAEASFLRRDHTARLTSEERAPVERMRNWQNGEMTPPETVLKWESLPFVVSDRESVVFELRKWPEPTKLLNREEAIERLGQLAAVEHAILVEYLYAAYSIDTHLLPPGVANPLPPVLHDQRERDLFAAANEILMIAIDEMHHLRWANEARKLLGAKEPVLERATQMQPKRSDGGRSFRLGPLTLEALDELIEIEAASQKVGGDDHTPEGIYTEVLLSIHQWPEKDCPEKARVMEILKIIIDEGEEHHQRLLDVRRILEKYPDYLRVRHAPRRLEDREGRELQELADRYYGEILQELRLAFEPPSGNAEGATLRGARRSMFNLHEAATELSLRGEGVLFMLPKSV